MSDQEILVVQSKVKSYIKAKSGMNTSGAVAERLSSIVRELCDRAIAAAKADGRKTVMDRDLSSSGM
jgi:histone H3/H4